MLGSRQSACARFGRGGSKLADVPAQHVEQQTPKPAVPLLGEPRIRIHGRIIGLQPAPRSGEVVTDDMLLSALSIN